MGELDNSDGESEVAAVCSSAWGMFVDDCKGENTDLREHPDASGECPFMLRRDQKRPFAVRLFSEWI